MAEQDQNQPSRRKARRTPGSTAETNGAPGRESAVDAMKAGYAKAEVKNQAARESLIPLGEGERPTVVTVGAVLSAVVALILWGSCAYALITGAEAGGREVNVFQWSVFASVVTLMAWGMWQAKYWAVLGFQMLLVLLIMACILGMVVAPTLLQILGTAFLTVGLSVLFWFMVKAMARLQMPERPGSN